MRLRAQRRNLVVWSQSSGFAGVPRVTRPARTRQSRRWIRIGTLLTLRGLLPLARGVRARWRVLLAGTALTVTGLILRGSPADSAFLLPGLMLLLSAPLLPGSPERGSELERELAGYTTAAQRHDLEAILDQYPDDVTRELREILAGHAQAADHGRRSRAFGRY
jgi:hypothetical protein